MTRDAGRAPEHPLIELARDLWDGLGGALAELPAAEPGHLHRYERAAMPPNGNGVHDDDFQIITIGVV
jgi:hypothetical protein